MKAPLLEKVGAFDKSGAIKIEADSAMESLKGFRARYPFAENPETIETLDPNDIFRVQSNEVGEFFHWLEYTLKPVGHLTLHGSKVYRHIRDKFEDFKELLYVAVDPKKSLAEKVDAPWDRISGLGLDRHIAKKIIFCFNHEHGDILPIFNTVHLEHFLNEIADKPEYPVLYTSLGETYEFLISGLLRVKQDLPETQSWGLLYFARFLYDSCPPPQLDGPSTGVVRGTKLDDKTRNEQIQFGEFTKLLNELQRKGRISGEEYRTCGQSWRERPQDRESLAQRLRLLLNK
jgi:hypothetical protein